MHLALNNLERLICHKTQPTKPNQLNNSEYFYAIQISYSQFYGFDYSYLIEIICTEFLSNTYNFQADL